MAQGANADLVNRDGTEEGRSTGHGKFRLEAKIILMGHDNGGFAVLIAIKEINHGLNRIKERLLFGWIHFLSPSYAWGSGPVGACVFFTGLSDTRSATRPLPLERRDDTYPHTVFIVCVIFQGEAGGSLPGQSAQRECSKRQETAVLYIRRGRRQRKTVRDGYRIEGAVL